MSGNRSGYDPQFVHMNAGAHRLPPLQLAAPALTWQRGYWRPGHGENGEKAITDEVWHSRIDWVLFCLFRELCPKIDDKFTCPNVDRSKTKADTLYLFNHKVLLSAPETRPKLIELSLTEKSVRHGLFSLRRSYGGVNLIVRATLHQEYFTLMFAVDFARELEVGEPQKKIRSAQTHIFALQGLVCAHHASSAGEQFYKLPDKDEEKLSNTQHHMIASMTDWIEELCRSAFVKRDGEPDVHLETCGQIFADIIGIIFGLTLGSTKNPPENHLRPTGKPAVPAGMRARIPALVRGDDFDKADALKLVDAVWPVVGSLSDRPDLEKTHGKSEFCISLFQENTALYISSLGRLQPDNSSKLPIVYTLVVSYESKWRLGRLVEQLHTMGTLRIAALRDLSAIGEANKAINEMSARLARQFLDRENVPQADDLRKEFDRIGNSVGNGLTLRIARSRYYVESFRNLMEMMKTGRVEGFQPYDVFVRRRLFDTFDYINRVGIRYDDLRRQIAFLIDSNQQHVIVEQTKATNDLLRTAEVLSVIPISYYAGSALSEIGAELARTWPIFGWPKWLYFLVGLALGLPFPVISYLARHDMKFWTWRPSARKKHPPPALPFGVTEQRDAGADKA